MCIILPIPPPQRKKMGAQCNLQCMKNSRAHQSSNVFAQTTSNLAEARFADCIFTEEYFPALGGGLHLSRDECREITCESMTINTYDPHTKETEQEVQTVINLKWKANDLPKVFTYSKGITKFHIPVVNALERVNIPHAVDKEFRLNENAPPHEKKRRKPNASEEPKAKIHTKSN